MIVCSSSFWRPFSMLVKRRPLHADQVGQCFLRCFLFQAERAQPGTYLRVELGVLLGPSRLFIADLSQVHAFEIRPRDSNVNIGNGLQRKPFAMLTARQGCRRAF
jgi:hypothetical protein